jgi:hypothetical protein
VKNMRQVLARLTVGYECYRILERVPAPAAAGPSDCDVRPLDDLGRAQLLAEAEAKPIQLAGLTLGPEALTLGLWRGTTLLAVALFEPASLPWIDAVWPSLAGSTALTELWTLATARNGGAATQLVQEAGQRIQGPLIAWTWWSNRAALRVFQKAGWRPIGWSFRVGSLPYMSWGRGKRR